MADETDRKLSLTDICEDECLSELQLDTAQLAIVRLLCEENQKYQHDQILSYYNQILNLIITLPQITAEEVLIIEGRVRFLARTYIATKTGISKHVIDKFIKLTKFPMYDQEMKAIATGKPFGDEKSKRSHKGKKEPSVFQPWDGKPTVFQSEFKPRDGEAISPRDKQVIHLYKNHRPEEIARRLGISELEVAEILIKNKVHLR